MPISEPRIPAPNAAAAIHSRLTGSAFPGSAPPAESWLNDCVRLLVGFSRLSTAHPCGGIHHLGGSVCYACVMPQEGTTNKVALGDIAWYLSPRLDEAECLSHARSAGGVVLRGIKGNKAANRLRQQGFDGRLWLDPAAYERPSGGSSPTLWDDWHQRQLEVGVAEFISPGVYVGDSDSLALGLALRSEGDWVKTHGGRLSLALHYSWLTKGLQALVKQLRDVHLPFALAFADRYDPLGRVGAVKGLVDLLPQVRDVTVMRCDIGAIGAVAHGAKLGAFGTSATMRHVFPPDQQGGGPSPSPAVFVEPMLSFMSGASLDALPRGASPACQLRCCNGQSLGRLNTRTRESEAIRHNRIAVRHVLDLLLASDPPHDAAFKQMCQQAQAAAERLSHRASSHVDVSAQVKAWAQLQGSRGLRGDTRSDLFVSQLADPPSVCAQRRDDVLGLGY